MSKRRGRCAGQAFPLFSLDGPGGPKFLRRLSARQGDQMVADGQARRFDHVETQAVLGYQMIVVPQRVVDVDAVKPTLQSMSCTFTRRETELLAGFEGESQTARLRRAWAKAGFRLDPDKVDSIETAQMKQRVYRSTH